MIAPAPFPRGEDRGYSWDLPEGGLTDPSMLRNMAIALVVCLVLLWWRESSGL